MSKFFKALQQAELERALRKQADPQVGEPDSSPTPQATEPDVVSESASPSSMGAATPRQEIDWSPSEPTLDLGRERDSVAEEIPRGIDRHLVSLLEPTSFEAEQYRTLRHLVEQLHKNADLHVVAITSPTNGDGKTITSINLAGSLAQAPKARVLLVEADLRRPSIVRYLGLGHASDNGLVDAILNPNLSLEKVSTSCPAFNLTVVPAGNAPASSYEVLKSPRLEELLNEARRRYDYIVLDTPPLIPLPDCRLLWKLVDGFLLVVAAHKTPRRLLEEAFSVLDPAKIAGLVFNGDDRPLAGYYHTYDKYDDHRQNGREDSLDRTGGRLSQLLRRALSRIPSPPKGGRGRG